MIRGSKILFNRLEPSSGPLRIGKIQKYGNRCEDLHIQGVLKMVHNIYVTRIYVEYQTKNSNVDFVLDE
jgi:hypothetical protein